MIFVGSRQELDRSTRSSNLGYWEAPKEWTTDFAEFVGLLWGDGCIASSQVSIYSHVDDVESIEELLLKVFGVTFKWHMRPECLAMRYCRINSTWFVRWLTLNGFVKAGRTGSLEAPHLLMKAPLEIKAAFLKGLFGADGCIQPSVHGRIVLSTKSLILANQVVLLLAELGMKSAYTKCYKEQAVFFSLRVNRSNGGLARFAEMVGFTSAKKQAILLASV